MKLPLLITALAGLASCQADETISGYADPDSDWVLQELDGKPYLARATIRFPEQGRTEGQAPCNSYFARQTAPYPWIEITGLGSTKMACPDLDAETAFFSALQKVSLAEVAGDTLILSDETGFMMLFRTEP